MQNRKTLVEKGGYSLDKITHLDEDGNVIKVTYEVIDPDGNVVDSFDNLDNLDDVRELFKSLVPELTQ